MWNDNDRNGMGKCKGCTLATADGVSRVNYKDDFEVRITMRDKDGVVDFPSCDFTVNFSTVTEARYETGCRKGVYNNCTEKNGVLHCYLDNHGLPPGMLKAEVSIDYPDENYADGSRKKVMFCGGNVELVKGRTCTTSADMILHTDIVFLDAYKLAVKKGYKGTHEEFYRTFSDLTETMKALKELETSVSKAEKEREEAWVDLKNGTREAVKDALRMLVPEAMEVSCAERLTLGDTRPEYIRAVLKPENVMQNVIFISDGGACTVDADGRIRAVKEGDCIIRIIPTCNTALTKTVRVKVCSPCARMVSSGTLRLCADGTFRMT